MKKQNLLKLAFTLMAVFIFTGAMAQNTGATGVTGWEDDNQEEIGDYVRSAATPIDDHTTVTYGDKVTVNKTMPFWVWPSAAYNPNFDFTDITAFAAQADIEDNVTSDFVWQTGADFAGLGDVAGFTKNYVEISWAVAEGDLPATRLIGVTETPAAGICAADPIYFGVTVIDEPMVRFDDPGATQVGVDSVIAWGCAGTTDVDETATALAIALDNGDELPIGDASYHVNVKYTVYTCDIDGATGDLDWDSRSKVGSPTIEQLGQDGTSAISQANPVIATSTELFAGENYGLEASKATVYEYKLENWNAGISRKSDYLALDATSSYGDYSYYDRNTTADLYNRIVVLAAPETGPIYHIPNDFEL